MAQLSMTQAFLRIWGGDLIPEDITSRLGRAPSQSQRTGDVLGRSADGTVRTARGGSWGLKATRSEPGNLNGQVEELLAGLTSDLGVWRGLLDRYHADIFCGLFLSESNEGMSLSPSTLLALGQRGLTLQLDIYGGNDGLPPEAKA